MFGGRRKNRGQSTLEYAMVIACTVGAFITMQFYTQRGMQGRLRAEADNLGQQYSPRHTTSSQTITSTSSGRTVTETWSEKNIYDHCEEEHNRDSSFDLERCREAADIDGDGDNQETDVFATRTFSTVGEVDPDTGEILTPDVTTQSGSETVGSMGTDLLGD